MSHCLISSNMSVSLILMLQGSILRMVLWSLLDKRYIFPFCLLQILFCYPLNNGTFWRVACISGFGFTLHPSRALSWKAIVPCALGQEALWVARQQRGSERGEGDSAPDQWETHSWGRGMGAGRIKTGPRDSSAWSRHSIFGEALWLLSPPSCPRGHYKMSSRPHLYPHQCHYYTSLIPFLAHFTSCDCSYFPGLLP